MVGIGSKINILGPSDNGLLKTSLKTGMLTESNDIHWLCERQVKNEQMKMNKIKKMLDLITSVKLLAPCLKAVKLHFGHQTIIIIKK